VSGGPFEPRGQPAPAPPRPAPEPPRPPQGRTSSVTWILGVALVLLATVIVVNAIRTKPNGSRGIAPGSPLPQFAVPLATSNLVGDANVAATGRHRACNFHDPRAIDSCDLAARGPVVLAFFAIASTRCEDQVSMLDRLRPRYPGYQFVAISIRGDRDQLVDLIRRRGWTLPVGYDRDGAVANEYAVAVCPTITFARRGGRVVKTTLGSATQAEVVRDLDALR
jgi:hypothetical protein